MKEKGGEGRERKERDIYIYKIYRWLPSCLRVLFL